MFKWKQSNEMLFLPFQCHPRIKHVHTKVFSCCLVSAGDVVENYLRLS